MTTFEDETFTDRSAGNVDLEYSRFVGCSFRSCDFTGASMRGGHFVECRFESADLTAVDVTDAQFHDVTFDGSRLRGANFAVVRKDALGITTEFNGCDLSLTSFRGLDLTGCAFRACNLTEAEFVSSNATGVEFTGCDFTRASFGDTNLTNADFRGAKNYVLSPASNRVRGLHVDWPEAAGLLVALGIRLEV